jgi:hypothetical protein
VGEVVIRRVLLAPPTGVIRVLTLLPSVFSFPFLLLSLVSLAVLFPVLVAAYLRFGGGPRPLQWGLDCLLGRSPLLTQGHASNQQCRSGQPTKTGRNGTGRRERAIPPPQGIVRRSPGCEEESGLQCVVRSDVIC